MSDEQGIKALLLKVREALVAQDFASNYGMTLRPVSHAQGIANDLRRDAIKAVDAFLRLEYRTAEEALRRWHETQNSKTGGEQ